MTNNTVTNGIYINDEVEVTHPITKEVKVCKVLAVNSDTQEVLVSLSAGCSSWKKTFDVRKV